MKNQYVGDIGDYGKYAMLRMFAEAGVKVGVNWYLTENDGSNDGRFTEYLKSGRMRHYAPEIYDTLLEIADKNSKSVQDIQERNIIPGALFYADLLHPDGSPKEREAIRAQWFERSIVVLADADLIFMDPDNGMLVSGNASKQGAEKYILPEEAERYFRDGHNVVYYCHKGRRTYNSWSEYISYLFHRNPDAMPCVLTYHKGTQRSYVFMIHEKDFVRYRKIIDQFQGKWWRIVSEEFTDRGDVASVTEGNVIEIEKSDGTIISIGKRADGSLEIRSSRQPGTALIITADYLSRLLGI